MPGYPYQSAFMALKPRCYWPLENASGAALVGNTMVPTGNGGVLPIPGPSLVRGSLASTRFNRSLNQRYDAAHDSSIEFVGGAPFTLCWWMSGAPNATFGSDYNIFTQRDDNAPHPGWQALWGFASADRISVVFDGGGAGEDEAFLSSMAATIQPLFICTVFDGTDLLGYRNGIYISFRTPSVSIADSGAIVPTRIGANQGGSNSYSGDLSDVGALDYALTPTQIGDLYQVGAFSASYGSSPEPPTIMGRGAA